VNTTLFELPPLNATVGSGGRTVTITDHEPLLAEFSVTRT